MHAQFRLLSFSILCLQVLLSCSAGESGNGTDPTVRTDGCRPCAFGDPACPGCQNGSQCYACPTPGFPHPADSPSGAAMAPGSGSSPNVTALLLGLAFVLLALCCCPLCCLCYAALQFKALRERNIQYRDANFAAQWRMQNPVVPFDAAKEWPAVATGWEAWQFRYSPLPWEFDGLSTEAFQSPSPELVSSRRILQEINFNPGIGSHRRQAQSVQCRLPLWNGMEPIGPQIAVPRCSYFEVCVVRYGRSRKTVGTVIQGTVAIGLSTRPAPPFRLPGEDAVSIGFHSRRGMICVGGGAGQHQGRLFGAEWNSVGSTVGCGYDSVRGCVFFTVNGGPPLCTTFAVPGNGCAHLFPTIGADCDVTVVVNMGQCGFRYRPAAVPTTVGSPVALDSVVVRS